MSSQPPAVELFKGTSWEECHRFILAIRSRALWEGKQRDSAWKADFAATLFWHKALLWHSRLPENVQTDWSKLEIALLERWPPPNDDDEPHIEPTPAAAPSIDRANRADRPLQGILKVVSDGSNTASYARFTAGYCDLTTNANEAMRVHCNSLLGTTLLERMDLNNPSWLAAQWMYSNPKIESGSSDFAWVPLVDPVSLQSTWSDINPLQIISCTVLDSGEVIPVWKKSDGSKIRLFAMTNGTYLYLVTDVEAFVLVAGSAKRGKMFIEATD